MRARLVEPEFLDSLPHDRPDALISRGEDSGLVRFAARSHRELAKRWTGMDFAPAPTPALLPEGTGWLQEDFLAVGPAVNAARADIVVANLILHHFQDDQLALLGPRLHRPSSWSSATAPDIPPTSEKVACSTPP